MRRTKIKRPAAGSGPGGFARADEGEVQAVGPEKIAGHGTDFARGDAAQAPLDCRRPNHPSVAEPLFANPIHLIVGAFEAEVGLADDESWARRSSAGWEAFRGNGATPE